jgi:protein-disulfide isomerase
MTKRTSAMMQLGLSGLGLLALAIAGCNRPPSESSTASASACADYSAKICKAAGDASPTCASVKETTELMPASACAAALKDVDSAVAKLANKRKPCDDLIGKLCAGVGEKTESCTMATTQLKTFPVERCTEMLQHLPEVIASLKQREAANQPLTAEAAAALTAGAPPSFGPADSKVTIVEFSDFECPYCSQAANAVHAIKAKYADRVRFVFRQFPLPMHPNAQIAAEASLAAHAQGKFWQLHDKMFENQRALDRASLEGYAKAAGINMAAFKKSLDTNEFTAAVTADVAMGSTVAVQGTPTMFINGARVENPTDAAALSARIDALLAGK